MHADLSSTTHTLKAVMSKTNHKLYTFVQLHNCARWQFIDKLMLKAHKGDRFDHWHAAERRSTNHWRGTTPGETHLQRGAGIRAADTSSLQAAVRHTRAKLLVWIKMTITVSAKLDPYQMGACIIQSIKAGCTNRTRLSSALMFNQDFRSSTGGFTLAAMSYESQQEQRITSLWCQLFGSQWPSVLWGAPDLGDSSKLKKRSFIGSIQVFQTILR